MNTNMRIKQAIVDDLDNRGILPTSDIVAQIVHLVGDIDDADASGFIREVQISVKYWVMFTPETAYLRKISCDRSVS